MTFVSLMGVGRMLSGTLGPIVASTLWQAIAASAPFIGCAVLKIGYDLTLFRQFRKVLPPEEEEQLLLGQRQAVTTGPSRREVGP